MSILHMDSEEVEFCALKLREQSETIRQQAQILAVLARSVDWYGPSRDTFQHEAEKIARSLAFSADEGQILASRILHEVEEWHALDEHFVQQFSKIIFLPVPRG